MKTEDFRAVNSWFENNKQLLELLNSQNALLETILSNQELPQEQIEQLLKLNQDTVEIIQRKDSYDAILDEVQTIDLGILCSKKQMDYYNEHFPYLQKLAADYNLSLIYFTIEGVDIENEVIIGNIISPNVIKESAAFIPPIIYNMAQFTKLNSMKTMRKLRIMDKVKLINPINKFNQAILFDIASSLAISQAFILPYTTFSENSLMEYLKTYDSVYLLPEKGISTKRNIIIEKTANNQGKGYYLWVGINKYHCSENELFIVLKKIVKNRKYIIMKGIKIFQWNQTPLEARIYLNKDTLGRWEITEMIAKSQMFSTGSIFYNNNGLFTKVLLDIYPEKVDDLEEKITKYSLSLATYLDYFINDLGSCTLDFIIDEDATPYLIYVGGWDVNDFLLQLDEKYIWKNYFKKAIAYLNLFRKLKEKGASNEMD